MTQWRWLKPRDLSDFRPDLRLHDSGASDAHCKHMAPVDLKKAVSVFSPCSASSRSLPPYRGSAKYAAHRFRARNAHAPQRALSALIIIYTNEVIEPRTKTITTRIFW